MHLSQTMGRSILTAALRPADHLHRLTVHTAAQSRLHDGCLQADVDAALRDLSFEVLLKLGLHPVVVRR